MENTYSHRNIAAGFGYDANDLANWDNHITKLIIGIDIDDRQRTDGSSRVY